MTNSDDQSLLAGRMSEAMPVQTCEIAEASFSGASRDRTGDLLLAKQALSQLSYGPW
jgi:hypothetical protein